MASFIKWAVSKVGLENQDMYYDRRVKEECKNPRNLWEKGNFRNVDTLNADLLRDKDINVWGFPDKDESSKCSDAVYEANNYKRGVFFGH